MNKTGCIIINILAILLLWTSMLQAQEKTFTVVIDAGHGGKDPGAKGAHINEKAINLAVALKLGRLITDGYKDVNVLYTRKTDCFIELNERANIANRNKADLFISIHANSLKKGCLKINGTETYTLGLAKSEENQNVAMLENSVILLEDNYLQRYEGFDPNSAESYIIFEFVQNKHMEQSISFASEIQKSFSSAKRVNRGVRQAGFLVLKATTMPGVLVELGFICNPDEERYMRSTEGQNQLAKAIYKAFAKYKNEHSRKQGLLQESTGVSPTKPMSEAKPSATAPGSTNATQGKIIYKIQILSSEKKLPANSPLLKGYKADYYQDGKLYKYTCGESTEQRTIQKMLKTVSKDFNDAFIIRIRDGKRLK
ncbi:MAG: N-acetylmuramoyl-L-alanine amidase [Tannerella sp.]|jgi:N-acetylmuramoyl-L-alanine amidase|nr:N-acetylmuramoyl-L-alanine amidase [Tannerella sp.]